MIMNLIKRAAQVIYNPKKSGLGKDNVQDAIDAVAKDTNEARVTLGLSKNILNHTLQSQVKYGVTITVNDDKSITLNGTATAEIGLGLMGDYNTPMLDTSKEYIISGTPEGGGRDNYCLRVRRKFSNGSIYPVFISPEGYKTEIETEFNAGIVLLEIYVAAGVTLNNVTFYPMISLEGGAYEPYSEVDRIENLENEVDNISSNLSQLEFLKLATHHHGQGTITSWDATNLTATVQLTTTCKMRNDIPSIVHLTLYVVNTYGYCEYYGIYNRWRGEKWNEIVCNYDTNCKVTPFDYTNIDTNNIFEMTGLTLKAENSETIERLPTGSIVFVEIY